MKFDFSNERMFDNHTHLLNIVKCETSENDFLDNLYHGKRCVIGGNSGQISAEAFVHLRCQGTVRTLVHLLSQYLGCEENLEAVVTARNAVTVNPEAIKEYVRKLYADSLIEASMLDSELPFGDEATGCIPGTVLRLYQYEKPMMECIENSETFAEARDMLLGKVIKAHKEGFKALKGHVGERFGFDLVCVSGEDAQEAFVDYKSGNKAALKTVYTGIFSDLLIVCRELDMPVNLHSGTTGMGKYNQVNSLDPSLMAPFLSDSKHINTKIVFLHAGYPFVKQLGMLAYNFPYVYADLSQTLPWWGISFSEVLRDMISSAPHDKIILGSGQHGIPETSWMAAKVAKKVMAKVMEDIVAQDLMSEDQAIECAKGIFYNNAAELYGING